jgi:hypothetical protein
MYALSFRDGRKLDILNAPDHKHPTSLLIEYTTDRQKNSIVRMTDSRA